MLQVGLVDRTSTAAIILAGGGSTRFGSDKTQARLGGITVLDRVLGAVAPLTTVGLLDEVVVVGDRAPDGVRHEPEPVRGLGPLAGLSHGWTLVETEVALVLAADHPLLVPELLSLLVERALADPLADAVVPLGPDGTEPLVACYRRRSAVVVDEQLAAGRRSLRGVLDSLAVDLVGQSVWSTVDPTGASFVDVDTPAELEQLARSAPEGDQLD